jgi:hypothetical protein
MSMRPSDNDTIVLHANEGEASVSEPQC